MVVFSKFTMVAKAKRGSLNSSEIVSLKTSKRFKLRTKIIILFTLGLLIFLGLKLRKQKPSYIKDPEYIPPLVMTGGDPYIRALM